MPGTEKRSRSLGIKPVPQFGHSRFQNNVEALVENLVYNFISLAQYVESHTDQQHHAPSVRDHRLATGHPLAHRWRDFAKVPGKCNLQFVLHRCQHLTEPVGVATTQDFEAVDLGFVAHAGMVSDGTEIANAPSQVINR